MAEQATAEVPEVKWDRVEWICLGYTRISRGKELGLQFRPIVDGAVGDRSQAHIYDTKGKWGTNGLFPRPGAVYTVEVSGGSVRPASLTYIEMWEDKPQVAVWQVASRAEEAAFKAGKNEKRETEVNEMLEALRPLRKLYFNTNDDVRRQLEVLLLNYLRRWTREDMSREEY